MWAVVNTFEKNDLKDEIKYVLVNGNDLPKYLEQEKLELICDMDGKHTEVFFFDTQEQAEECMGSK